MFSKSALSVLFDSQLTRPPCPLVGIAGGVKLHSQMTFLSITNTTSDKADHSRPN